MNNSGQKKDAYWQGIVQAAETASIPKVRWCEENGVHRSQLYYWRKKFKGSCGKGDEPREQLDEEEDGKFIEMDLRGVQGERRLASEPAFWMDYQDGVTIQIADCRILVGANTEAKTLAMVLGVIRSA